MVRLATLLVLIFLSGSALAGESARELYNQGVQLMNQGRAQEAIDLFKRATEADPQLALAHYNLGVALGQTARYQEAAAAYQEATRIDPTYAPAFMNLGAAHQHLGHVQEALDAYREAARLRPDDVEASFGVAWMLLVAGQKEAARAQYAVLSRLDRSRADNLYRQYGALDESGAGSQESAPAPSPEPPATPSSPSPEPTQAAATASPVAVTTAVPAGGVELSYCGRKGTCSRYRLVTQLRTSSGGTAKGSSTRREVTFKTTIRGVDAGVFTMVDEVEAGSVTKDGQPRPIERGTRVVWKVTAAGERVRSTPGPSSLAGGLIRFPERPVRVGETWDVTASPGGWPRTPLRWTATLVRLEPVAGVECARIALKAGGHVEDAAVADARAVWLFDPARHRVVKARLKVSLESPARPEPARPGGVATQTFEASLDLVP